MSKKNFIFLIIFLIVFLSLLYFLPKQTKASPDQDPYTITIGEDATATRIEQQRKVFRNPRGQKYYYALIYDATQVLGQIWTIYKSSDGTNWTSTGKQIGSAATSPSWWVWEDSTNSRLIIWVVAEGYSGPYDYMGATAPGEIHLTCFSILDTATEPGQVYATQVGVKTDDAVHNPVVVRADNGYLWVAWVDEYTSEGKQRFDIYVKATTTQNPTSPPIWTNVVKVFDGSSLTKTVGPNKIEIVPLTATANIGIIYSFYNDGAAVYNLRAKTGSYSGSGNPTLGTEVSFTNPSSSMLHSSVAETDPNSDVFVIFHYFKAGEGHNVFCEKWDVSGNSKSSFGSIFDGPVDSLALGIDKTSSPDKLYAFFIVTGVSGKIFYSITGVDLENWSIPSFINDDTESLDYLSVSYEDWNRDSSLQLIYTQQTSRNVRFAYLPPAPPALIDCGLRVFDGTSVIKIACEPAGTLTSPLRIRKGDTTYGIILVEVTDTNSSKIRIQTSSGIKALRKY